MKGADVSQSDRYLADVAGRQHGLITHSDVEAAGLSVRTMQRRVDRGIYVDEGHRMWRVRAWPRTDEQLWLAVCLAHGDGAVIASYDAARLHQMPCKHESDRIHVLCPYGTQIRRPGVVGHRSRLIVPADRTIVRAVPVTSWARTWVDLSARADLSNRQLLWIYDEGIRRRSMTADDAHRTAGRLRSGPGRSMRRVWRLLGQRPLDHDPGASQPESNIALWLRAAGYGKPAMNLLVVLEGIRWEIDVAYHRERIAIEYNSEEFHGGPMREAQEKDERKRVAFEAAGWAFFVFGPDMDERTVVETVGAEIERRRTSTV